MANVKISEMTPGSALDGSELFEMVQSGSTRSTDVDAIKTYVQGSGGIIEKVRVVTAAGAVTVADTDGVVVVNKTAGAATTVNLPVGVTGATFTVKDGKGDAATNNITIDPDGVQTIDGGATYVMTTNWQSVTVIFNGSAWNLI